MSDVQFDDQQPQEPNSFKSRTILGESATPGMSHWFIKIGIVKSERSAGYLMIFLTVLFFSLSIYFFIMSTR